MRKTRCLYPFLCIFLFGIKGCREPSLRDYQKRIIRQAGNKCIVDVDQQWKTKLKKPEIMRFDPGKEYFWILDTNEGTLKIKLWPNIAPIHVTNMIYLTRLKFYGSLTFHRIIPGFIVQGGCPCGDGSGGPGYFIESEIREDIKHDRPYLVGSVNHGENTDGSQFYLTFRRTPSLDGEHAIFGEVIEGQNVMNSIELLGSPNGIPKQPLRINKALIEIEVRVNPSLLPPKNVSASQMLTDGIFIEWDEVRGAKMYRIIRSQKNDKYLYAGPWQEKCSFSDVNARSGEEYYYCVQACGDKSDEDSYSDYSEKVIGVRKKKIKKGPGYMPIDY